MLTKEQTARFNSRLMEKLSLMLDRAPDFIEAGTVDELVEGCGVTREFAFSVLLAAAIGLDTADVPEDKALFENYFPSMLHRLDAREYQRNPYYQHIRIPEARTGRWEFKQQRYKPYEAFVCNDLEELSDGRVIPQIGYFDREFRYPAVLENGREWMLITPNEIETMRPAIDRSTGSVLTYRLGLGYYAYMVSEKVDVSSVTIVEKDEDVIQLFTTVLLPQFGHADKIKIVRGDAFDHAGEQMAAGKHDLVFTDLWHDPSDGVDLYLRMKGYEKLSPRSTFMYWIEKTLLHYV